MLGLNIIPQPRSRFSIQRFNKKISGWASKPPNIPNITAIDSNSIMAIDTSLVAVAAVSGMAGALLTSVINAWSQHKQRKFDLIKHQRELIFKTAIEHWKENSKITAEHQGFIEPIDLSVVHIAVLSSAVFDEQLNADNIKKRLEENSKIIHASQEYYFSIKKFKVAKQ